MCVCLCVYVCVCVCVHVRVRVCAFVNVCVASLPPPPGPFITYHERHMRALTRTLRTAAPPTRRPPSPLAGPSSFKVNVLPSTSVKAVIPPLSNIRHSVQPLPQIPLADMWLPHNRVHAPRLRVGCGCG